MFALGGSDAARIGGCDRLKLLPILVVFHEEAGNIGSQLIAMPVLQQQDRVHRPAEKAVADQG
jgi:hypothetical protein